MAGSKTYIPSFVVDTHRQVIFLARYGAVLRAAIAAIDPEAATAFDTVKAALILMDSFYQTLYPIGD